ncbi:hypothetical protein PTSG_07455 [Salpingoeca rosetta]|uniref:Calponin-homology (CH) domain-containing protein n=1 Tax=Salpingoeca rosetta (strain ATCC 50818 / BSB-021) TaxID=946362 RepID=F2UIS2_SALR5|nr:uncharacterized protein PTSG_07455 [Salpingoeca rosetta]EGD77121.1 hypothetical protein PTSG_07455 [Salpingoeca rosetta]|eukprot:XP_004990960.1 hypothetical protein PTSG_07455 [Salpingoeca rosetta]
MRNHNNKQPHQHGWRCCHRSSDVLHYSLWWRSRHTEGAQAQRSDTQQTQIIRCRHLQYTHTSIMPKTWLTIQCGTFQRWANWHLEDRGLFVHDIIKGFRDGVTLANLIELLSGEAVKHYPQPHDLEECEYNIRSCLRFLKDHDALYFKMEATHIMEADAPVVLSLIWSLILKYKLLGRWESWEELMSWVNSHIGKDSPFNLHTKNFTTDWNDGHRVCALIEAMKPGTIDDFETLDDYDEYACAEYGISVASEELDIPPLLTPEDMVSPNLDELSTITYLTMFREVMESKVAGVPVDPGARFDNAQTNGLIWDDDAVTVNLHGAILDYESDSEDEVPAHRPSVPAINTESIEHTLRQALDRVPPAIQEEDEVSSSGSESESESESETETEAEVEEEKEEDVGEALAMPEMPQGLEVRVRNGPVSAITLEDLGRCDRGMSFIPDQGFPPGVYEIDVLWRGEPVQGSPFTVASDDT